MFAEEIWGLGALGSSGEEFVGKLYNHAKPLWNNSQIKPFAPINI
jgi:hypothetical protein